MMKKVIAVISAAIFIISLCFTCTSTAKADPVLDLNKKASFSIIYQYEDEKFEGLQIRTYRVAEIKEDYMFALTGDFTQYPVVIYDIQSQAEWRIAAETLADYAVADQLQPTAQSTTDVNGLVEFTNLETGLYLTLAVQWVNGVEVVAFENFLTVLPYMESVDNYNYNVTAYPKSGKIMLTYDDVEYKVMKQWRDNGNNIARQAVTVDILQNGVLRETVKLSEENNWTYKWTAVDDGSTWIAVERDVLEDYTVSFLKNGSARLIVNTYVETPVPTDTPNPTESAEPTGAPEPTSTPKVSDTPGPTGAPGETGTPRPTEGAKRTSSPKPTRTPKPSSGSDTPKTGDTVVVWPYVMSMSLSGCVLIVVGMFGKRENQ